MPNSINGVQTDDLKGIEAFNVDKLNFKLMNYDGADSFTAFTNPSKKTTGIQHCANPQKMQKKNTRSCAAAFSAHSFLPILALYGSRKRRYCCIYCNN